MIWGKLRAIWLRLNERIKNASWWARIFYLSKTLVVLNFFDPKVSIKTTIKHCWWLSQQLSNSCRENVRLQRHSTICGWSMDVGKLGREKIGKIGTKNKIFIVRIGFIRYLSMQCWNQFNQNIIRIWINLTIQFVFCSLRQTYSWPWDIFISTFVCTLNDRCITTNHFIDPFFRICISISITKTISRARMSPSSLYFNTFISTSGGKSKPSPDPKRIPLSWRVFLPSNVILVTIFWDKWHQNK